MSDAQIDLNWLCEWLEENSSGVYRPAKEAAHVIRNLRKKLGAAEEKIKVDAVQYKREIRDIEAVLSMAQHENKIMQSAIREAREQKPYAYRIVNHLGVESVHQLIHPEEYKRDYPNFIVEPLFKCLVPAMPMQKEES